MPTEEVVTWQQPQFTIDLTPVDVTMEFNAAGAGPQGPPGATGAQGNRGAQGDPGPPGIQGVAGAPGATPTVAAGTTTTLAPGTPASVTDVGTPAAAVFDFAIPQGIQGDQGVPGQVGPPGPPGGATAYTTLSAAFTMPAVNASAVASVASASAFQVGNIVYISPIGYLNVTAVNSGTNQLTLQNLGYGVNQAPGSSAPSGNTLTGVGPQGPPGTTGAPGSPGAAATATAGTTATLSPGANATVTNVGTPAAAVFNFGIPAGVAGAQGSPGTPGAAGAAATVAAGTTTTGAPGSQANVTNVGTPAAAVFNFLIPAGVAGAAGSPGAAGTPGNPGSPGQDACSTISSQFTVPAVGQSVTVVVASASWLALGQMVYVANAGGSNVAGAFQVTAIIGNQVTLLNPVPVAIPNASASQAGLMAQTSGNTTDFVDGTNTCQNLVTAIQPTIWIARRTFNAVGNCGFECTQRNVGNSLTNPATGTFIEDRWQEIKSGSANVNYQVAVNNWPNSILVPGTSFNITRNYLHITNQAVVSTLAAGDYCSVRQQIEGSVFRELSADVHSFSILARSSVANLSFGISLVDNSGTRTLSKLCQLGAANTAVLLTFPNLPVFPSAGGFSVLPGVASYVLYICLAAGSTYANSANDAWQNNNTMGAAGQSNFCGTPIGSTLDVFFVQHEPGAVCTTLMDKPFTQNYDECLRYFQKSYNYGIKPGSAGSLPGVWFHTVNQTTNINLYNNSQFPKRMAKNPTCSFWSNSGQVANQANLAFQGFSGNVGLTAYTALESGISGITVSGSSTAPAMATADWTADTGW